MAGQFYDTNTEKALLALVFYKVIQLTLIEPWSHLLTLKFDSPGNTEIREVK